MKQKQEQELYLMLQEFVAAVDNAPSETMDCVVVIDPAIEETGNDGGTSPIDFLSFPVFVRLENLIFTCLLLMFTAAGNLAVLVRATSFARTSSNSSASAFSCFGFFPIILEAMIMVNLPTKANVPGRVKSTPGCIYS